VKVTTMNGQSVLIDVCMRKKGGLRLLKQEVCKSCGVPVHLQRLYMEGCSTALGEKSEDDGESDSKRQRVKNTDGPGASGKTRALSQMEGTLTDFGVLPGQELVLLVSDEFVLGHSRTALADCAERAGSQNWGLTRLLLPFAAPRSGHVVLLLGKFTAVPTSGRLLARAVGGLPRRLRPDESKAVSGHLSSKTRVAQAVEAVEVDVASIEVGKVCEVRLARPLSLEKGQYVELCVVDYQDSSSKRFESRAPHYFHIAADKETKRTCYFYSMCHSTQWAKPDALVAASRIQRLWRRLHFACTRKGLPPLARAPRVWRAHLLEMDREFEASDIALSVVMT